MSELKTLMVLVPAYNEGETIAETLVELDAVLAKMEGDTIASGKILVIDDGSKDQTAAEVEACGLDRVMLLRNKINMRLGATVRIGIQTARQLDMDMILKIDADRQHDPNDIPAMIAPLLEDRADVVYGKRWQRISYRMPLVRRLGNIFFSSMMRFLTGWDVKDSQPGIFALNKRCMRVVRLPGDYNYTQQVMLSANLGKMRFAHVDVSFAKREAGSSFVKLTYPFTVLPQILMVILGARPLKVFGMIAAVFLFMSGAVFTYEALNWLFGDQHKVVVSVNFVLGTLFFGLQALLIGLVGQLLVDQYKSVLDLTDPHDLIGDITHAGKPKQK